MRFGLAFANISRFSRPEGAVALARAAEDAGFDSLWTVEHVVVPAGYESDYPYSDTGRMPGRESSPIPDPLIWLSYLASATSTIKLATGILIAPQRNPVVLAKEAATLDSLCGGRVVLGVGAGWLEEEFRVLGVPFEERGKRLDDHIGALRALWSQSPASYDGAYTRFADVYCEPRPAAGAIPIVVGGHSRAAARRAGRLGDGFFPGRGSLEELSSLIAVMREAATDAGRDPDAIEVTGPGQAAFADDPIGALRAHEEAGVSRIVVPPLTFDPNVIGEVLGRFGEDVIAKMS
jgi:probable F420-dependent oxidoreductase